MVQPPTIDSTNRVLNRTENAITIRARAKVNLTLRVCGKLDNGYHFLQSLVCPISLADSVTVERTAAADRIECVTELSPALAAHMSAAAAADSRLTEKIAALSSTKNLAAQAAGLMCQQLALPGGARIHIEKHIPLEAGLGGGSADAAAVLIALDELFALRLTPKGLFDLGAQVGSDVPAVLADKLVLMTGRGERVSEVCFTKPWRDPVRALIVKPLQSVSTAAAYEQLRIYDSISAAEVSRFGPESGSVKVMLAEQSLELAGAAAPESGSDKQLTLLAEEGISGGPILGSRSVALPRFANDFQSVILGHYAETRAAGEQLAVSGAEQVLLAGSGSALVGFFETEAQMSKARSAFKAAEANGWFVAEVRLEPDLRER